MSLVQFVLSNNFILVCGDNKAIDEEHNFSSESCNKVIKINKNIIIGCSGNLRDCHELLSKHCDLSITNGISVKSDKCSLSYHEFISGILRQYEFMEKIHINNFISKKYNFTDVICGFNGREFVANVFSLHLDQSQNQKALLIEIPKRSPYICFCLGEPGQPHYKNLLSKIENRNPTEIIEFQNIMKDVLNEGLKTDRSINNICHFETIQLKDVIIK